MLSVILVIALALVLLRRGSFRLRGLVLPALIVAALVTRASLWIWGLAISAWFALSRRSRQAEVSRA